MSKITAVVILYYPSSDVIDNINSYVNNLKTLYVICNSDIEDSLYNQLLAIENIKIIHKYDNIGIAKALNLTLEHASKEDEKWLMTLDQDSSFNEGEYIKFIKNFDRLKNKKNLAIFSPIHNNKFINNSIEERDFVMTSANIVNIQRALDIGGYDENLFIDEVDHEFCFRLQKNSYKIVQDNSIAINHNLGKKVQKKSKKIILYNSIRLYYMTRNYFYVKKKYKSIFPIFFKKRDRYILIFLIKQIYYGQHRIKNIRMILQGIIDYRQKKYGKYNG